MVDYDVTNILNGREVLQCDGYDPSNRVVIFTDDEHSLIREHFWWGSSYDADMNPLPQTEYVLLKDITDSHLEALIKWTEDGYPAKVHKIFVDEMNCRFENKGDRK